MERADLFIGGVRLFDDGDEDVYDVIIENGIISGISRSAMEPPDGFELVDGRGKWLMPGLMDAHVHLILNGSADPVAYVLGAGDADFEKAAADNAKKALASGFTYLRDMGCVNFIVPKLRDEFNASGIGPGINAAGHMLVGMGAHVKKIGRPLGDSREKILFSVKHQVGGGADFIKIIASGGLLTRDTSPSRTEVSGDMLAIASDAAAEAGRDMAVHAYSDTDVRASLVPAVRSIEHGSFAGVEALKAMADLDAFLVPTLKAAHAILENSDCLPTYMSRNAVEAITAAEKTLPMAEKQGVKLALGTDSGTPYNYFGDNIEEIKYMSEYKISNETLLASLFSNPSELMGIADNYGKLAIGYSADLLLLTANPVDDVLNIGGNISAVIKGGRRVDGSHFKSR